MACIYLFWGMCSETTIILLSQIKRVNLPHLIQVILLPDMYNFHKLLAISTKYKVQHEL